MAYKLSERLHQNTSPASPEEGVPLGKLATVFILFGLLSLLTAWVFSISIGQQLHHVVTPAISSSPINDESQEIAIIGPLMVLKYREVYTIQLASKLSENSWSFVEGEVLNARKEYLFSF